MRAERRNSGYLVLVLLASTGLLRAQAQPDAQGKPPCDCSEVEGLTARLTALERGAARLAGSCTLPGGQCESGCSGEE